MEKRKLIRQTEEDLLNDLKTKRVAIYARVSMESEVKHLSIENQIRYLLNYVKHNPDWEFVKSYVDEGVTGTTLDRPAFNQMINDARAGKIDIILTKSVSRMGRNSAELFNVLHELKYLGVTVVFDSEQIRTDNPQAMLNMQFRGIMAEKYSEQISKNQKWSIRKRYEEGIPNTRRPYGYILVNHQLQVIPKEAEVVKRIFNMYISGMGKAAICKVLNRENIKTHNGSKWQSPIIHGIIRNEVYIGDLLLQKTYITDFLSKRKKCNRGEIPRYYIPFSHQPIIDRETYSKAQQEIDRREKLYAGHNYSQDKKPRLFSQLIRCEHCGGSIYYKRAYGDTVRQTWICKTHTEIGAAYCPVKPIREDILTEATLEVLISENLIKKDTPLTNELLKKHISQIIAKDNYELEYHLYNGNVITKSCKCPSRSKSWTPEMKQKAREKSLAYCAAQKEVKHE